MLRIVKRGAGRREAVRGTHRSLERGLCMLEAVAASGTTTLADMARRARQLSEKLDWRAQGISSVGGGA